MAAGLALDGGGQQQLENKAVIVGRELAIALNLVRNYTREFPLAKKPGLLLIGRPGIGPWHADPRMGQRAIKATSARLSRELSFSIMVHWRR